MAQDSRLVFVAHVEDPPGTGLMCCTGDPLPDETDLPPGTPRQQCLACVLYVRTPGFMPVAPSALAQAAYAAYGISTGGLNYRGEPMPEWADLGESIQRAWVAAARAVEQQLRGGEPA
jgi:hypothetical protein